VKRAGATYVFDYRDSEVITKIQNALPTLGHVFDTIGSAESSATAAATLSKTESLFCTVRPGKTNTEGIPKNVTVTDVFVFTAFAKPHVYRGTAHWPVRHRFLAFTVQSYSSGIILIASKLMKK
jgi:hypothetical protein